MLVPEHDVEREHFLTVRLKTEVAGFDDTGVHGTDGHLVHFVAADLRPDANITRGHCARPRRRRVIRLVSPQRPQRRMTLRHRAALFGDLALEQRRVRTALRDRRIVLPDHRARRAEPAARIVGKDRQQAQPVVSFGKAEQRQQSPAVGRLALDDLGQFLGAHARHHRHWNGLAVPKERERRSGHGALPPSVAAAR